MLMHVMQLQRDACMLIHCMTCMHHPFIRHACINLQVVYGDNDENEPTSSEHDTHTPQPAPLPAPAPQPASPLDYPSTTPAPGPREPVPQQQEMQPEPATSLPPEPDANSSREGPKAVQSARPSLHAALEEAEVAMAVARGLDQGADVNERNGQGFTVLMVACSLGMVDAVHLLLGAGAQVHLTDPQGLNAVHITVVAREGPDQAYEEILQVLLQVPGVSCEVDSW
jgi:hypothetical protein